MALLTIIEVLLLNFAGTLSVDLNVPQMEQVKGGCSSIYAREERFCSVALDQSIRNDPVHIPSLSSLYACVYFGHAWDKFLSQSANLPTITHEEAGALFSVAQCCSWEDSTSMVSTVVMSGFITPCRGFLTVTKAVTYRL